MPTQRGSEQARGRRGRRGQRLPRALARDLRPAYTPTAQVKALGAPDPRPAGYPNANTLSKRLRTAAHLIKQPRHAGHHDPLGRLRHPHRPDRGPGPRSSRSSRVALAAFQSDLESRGIDQRVCTLVFSEFGRRVKETPSATAADAGTDHGAGGLMLAMGTGVKGGFAAEWPGCIPSKLVPPSPPCNPNQGNLQVPTDFRSVYLSVLQDWLGGDDPASLIDGAPVDPLHPRRRPGRAVREEPVTGCEANALRSGL